MTFCFTENGADPGDLTRIARATCGPVKPDAHDWIAQDVEAWRPFHTTIAFETIGLLGVPIHDERLQVIAMFNLMLPALGPKGRPHHIDLVLTLRRDQEVGNQGAS